MTSLAATYSLTSTPSKFKSLDLDVLTGTWADWVDEFSKHAVRAQKDGEGFVLGVVGNCPPKCRGAGRPCKGGVPHRLAVNVKSVHVLGFDLDGVTQGAIDQLTAELTAAGLAFLAYHTHGHQSDAYAKARVLVPLARPVELAHPWQWSGFYWPALMKRFGQSIKVDRAVKDPSRIFYAPAKPAEDSPHRAWHADGGALDAQSMCGAPPRMQLVTPEEVPQLESVDLAPIRERLQQVGKEPLASILARVLRGEAPVPPPDRRAPGMPSRYVAWRMVALQLALAGDPGTPVSALAEIIRGSFSAEVRESPQDYTEWSTVEGLIESAIPAALRIRAEHKAKRLAAIASFDAMFQRRLK